MRTLRLAVLTLALAPSLVVAQTSYPMITHTTPVAVRRGTATEVVVEGQMSFFGVDKALFDVAGLRADVTPPATTAVNPPQRPVVRSVKMKVIVDKACPLGVREFRLTGPHGVSSVGQLLVVDEAVVSESGDNNTREKANKIDLPHVVCGRIEALEDVDWFRFRAEAGQTLTFEVHGARLQDKIHDLQKHLDPLLTLFDADGRELAANDDAFFADPLLHYTVTRSGDYFLQVRDSKYDGDPRWVYALLATTKPYVAHAFPLAVAPGAKVTVETVGSAKQRTMLTAPTALGLFETPLDLGGVPSNPAAFVVSPLPLVSEQEPNDAPAAAQRLTLPCGVNGRLGGKRDLDHFAFVGTKGKAVRLEVKARRFGTALRSSVDAVLDVMTPKGQVLATNDDAFGKDAALVFAPPSDGDYVVRLRDLHGRGGDSFVYFLECDYTVPDFVLRCDPDKAAVGPGAGAAWFVHVERKNGFVDPVTVTLDGLPPGVSASPLTIPPTMTQGLVVLTAAADAKPTAAAVRIVGTAGTLKRTATPNQEIYLPGGGRGRFDVASQVVAVTEPSDIQKVDVSPKTLTLRPGGEVRIDVTVRRGPSYDKDVSLDVLLRHLGGVFGNPLPPGVTIDEAKSKTLLGRGDKGHIVLKAAADAAAIENVPVCVLAHVSVNFVVKVSYASPVLPLTVTKDAGRPAP